MTVYSAPLLHRGGWDSHCVAAARHHLETGVESLGTHVLQDVT